MQNKVTIVKVSLKQMFSLTQEQERNLHSQVLQDVDVNLQNKSVWEKFSAHLCMFLNV